MHLNVRTQHSSPANNHILWYLNVLSKINIEHLSFLCKYSISQALPHFHYAPITNLLLPLLNTMSSWTMDGRTALLFNCNNPIPTQKLSNMLRMFDEEYGHKHFAAIHTSSNCPRVPIIKYFSWILAEHFIPDIWYHFLKDSLLFPLFCVPFTNIAAALILLVLFFLNGPNGIFFSFLLCFINNSSSSFSLYKWTMTAILLIIKVDKKIKMIIGNILYYQKTLEKYLSR